MAIDITVEYAIGVDNAPSTPYCLAPCTPTPQFPVTVVTAVNSMTHIKRLTNHTLLALNPTAQILG